jgi:hypothetical protein
VLEAESGVTVVERAPGTRAEQRMPSYDRMRRNRRSGEPQELDLEELARMIMRGQG